MNQKVVSGPMSATDQKASRMFLKGRTARSTGRWKFTLLNLSSDTKLSSKPGGGGRQGREINFISLCLKWDGDEVRTEMWQVQLKQHTQKCCDSKMNDLHQIKTTLCTCFHDIAPGLVVELDQGGGSQDKSQPCYQLLLTKNGDKCFTLWHRDHLLVC